MFLTYRFFSYFLVIVLLFGLSFPWDVFFPLAQASLVIGCTLTLVDAYLLFRSKILLLAKRKIPTPFRLGEENQITLELYNPSRLHLYVHILDELPVPLQIRDFAMDTQLGSEEKKILSYELKPFQRGELEFGDLILYGRSLLGLVERRVRIEAEAKAAVYPVIDARISGQIYHPNALLRLKGFHQIRKLGSSLEFEQVSPYVRGDDYRHINWKASGHHGEWMVNRYQDEQAQQVYCILDHSRTMAQAFYGLSLLDYSINASLSLSKFVLSRHDQAGLISFGKKLHRLIRARKGDRQLFYLREALYQAQPTEGESNLEGLYQGIRQHIRRRSLLVLFTQMESTYALDRLLPTLRRLNQLHVLLVVFFINTEWEAILDESPPGTLAIYQQALARQRLLEQQTLAHRLRQYGIQVVLSRPDQLTLEVVNKYSELKARRLV